MLTDDEMRRIQRIETALLEVVGLQISTYGALISLWKAIPVENSQWKEVSTRLDEIVKKLNDTVKLSSELGPRE